MAATAAADELPLKQCDFVRRSQKWFVSAKWVEIVNCNGGFYGTVLNDTKNLKDLC